MTEDRDPIERAEEPPDRGTQRRVVANTAWLFVDKAVCTLVAVLVGAWVARYLRPGAFGQLSYAIAFVQFLVPIAGLGMQSIVIRNLVRDPRSKHEILGTALTLRLAVSVTLVVTLCVVVMIGGVGPYGLLQRWLIIIISTQLVFTAVSDTVGDWFESRTELKYVVWARDGATVLVAGLKITLILLAASLIAFGVATSAQALLLAGGLAGLFVMTGNRFSLLRVSTRRARELLSDSWPLIITGLAVVTYMRVDQIMLGHLSDSQTLGRYSAAVYLSELWYFIPVAVARSLFPSIVRAHAKLGPEVFRERLQTFFDAMALMAYVIAILLTIFASRIMMVLFGPDYAGSGPILQVHVWAFVFVALGEARHRWLMVENLVRFAMLATLIGAAMNIGLNLLLIPVYGGVGAAWATLASQALSAYFTSVLHPQLRPVFVQATTGLLVPFRLMSFTRSLREMLK